jgi:hypothetical protein
MNPLALLKLAWTGGTLAKAAEIIGAVALVFLLGFATGQHYTTKTAIDAVSDHDAADQAAQGKALIEKAKSDVARLNEHTAKERAADALTRGRYQNDLDTITTKRAQAERELAQLQEKNHALQQQNEGLKAVNKDMGEAMQDMASAPCVLPAGVRRVLDEASGAADPGDRAATGDSQERAAGGAADDAAARAIAPLTCDQLVTGYLNLSDWGCGLRAWVLAWQAWHEAAP